MLKDKIPEDQFTIVKGLDLSAAKMPQDRPDEMSTPDDVLDLSTAKMPQDAA